MNFIPLSVPNIKGNEWKYVKDCLDTGWVSSAGKYVELFENKISKYTGAKFSVACVNGTSALHLSLRIAGVKPGDEVIVPTVTFIAPINTVRYANANPVFMDCDEYFNIDANKTIDYINKETFFKNGSTFNKVTKKKITAIIVVHVFGNAVNIETLFEICRKRNIKIIEDASESLGTRYIKGKFSKFHTGTVGDIGCISFNGNKIITTGGGGMIVTNNKKYAEEAKYLSTQAKDDTEKFVHNNVGYNYRLTNLQAALGLGQMENLEEFIKIKKQNYLYYKKNIDVVYNVVVADTPGYASNNYWMYPLINKNYERKKFASKIISKLKTSGIQSRPVWKLNHLQRPYREFQNYKIERSIDLVENTICLPSSTNLSLVSMKYVIKTLKKNLEDE